jgi:phage-related minor tail protein
VARQIEELTSVVLDSAEVSTRSASIAADVSATMRAVVSKIQENNQRSMMHSRIMLGAFCACLLIAMGIFFAITMKMTKSIKELDTMVYAMAKRVIEVDASLTAIGKTNSDFSEITEKQEEVITTQTQVAKRLEEIGKSMAAMPTVVATEANKSSDLKFKDMQKQLSTLENKLQTFDNKLQSVADKATSRVQPPAPVAPQGPSTQVLLTEIQKLKSDLNAGLQTHERAQTAAEMNAAKAIEKSVEKAASASFEAQKAADKAALAAKSAGDALKGATEAQKAAAASEKASAAERLSQQKAAAERAVVMRMQAEKSEKSAEQMAAEKAAAEKAAAARAAAKASADRAAADRAAAEKAAAAAEKARAAAAAAAASLPPAVREKPIQYPRQAD